MNHWIFLPILLPLLTGISLLLTNRIGGLSFKRTLSVGATIALIPLASILLSSATTGNYQIYALGDWPAPYGIVLVLDRLSALMLVLTALVASFSLLYALGGTDTQGKYFHALFQFQLFGLNGAFLTGDLFNLFVFFEVLLIASYCLLLHGGGTARIRAGLHYVVLNLVGSILFLFAIGILYGVTGTLNMADLALKIAYLSKEHADLLRISALLLLIVFGLKAALLPLYFWLPSAYSHATAPVAALFAIMTKVGVYAIIRVFTLIFGPMAGNSADVANPWLLPLALMTLLAGTLGVLASRDLGNLIAYSVVASVGTLLAAVGLFNAPGLSAALVYLIHTTLITAGMFLLADIIRIQRGNVSVDTVAPAVQQPLLLGGLFFGGAIAMAGMPPLSGFLGKFMLLQAALEKDSTVIWIWSIVMITSLVSFVALSRMGSALFWKTMAKAPNNSSTLSLHSVVPIIALLLCSPLFVMFANLIIEFAIATSQQLTRPTSYMEQVLGSAYIDAFLLHAGEIP